MVYVIIGILFVAILLIGCALIPAMPENPKSAKILDNLADKYGGLYVFNKQFADEIEQREKEREEFDKKILDMSATDEEFRLNSKKYDINKTLPQTLSNGCRYYENKILFFQDRPEYAYYEDKIKEYIGAKDYDKLSRYMYATSYYECNEKIYLLAITLNIGYYKVKYGLFGDEGRGFSIARHYRVLAGTKRYSSTFYLIDGKFVKSEDLENDK